LITLKGILFVVILHFLTYRNATFCSLLQKLRRVVILAYFIFKEVNDLQLPAKIRCMRMGSAECLKKKERGTRGRYPHKKIPLLI
jgi:hypothetical protein